MAIDTENKRRSATASVGMVIFPRPDGAINAPDRAQAGGMYARAGASPPTSTLKIFGHHAKRQGPQRRLVVS